jgi:hypothetical protein
MRLTVWKDRPGRIRVMALLDNGKHEEARRYYYKKYHPKEDIKGLRILQLDMDPYNFKKRNLVAITPRIMNCLLNNHLLSNDPKLNKLAIKTLELDMLIKNGGIK